MAHTTRTLSLLPETWDVTLDSVGRIALTGGKPATLQNVANEARLFTGDAYFQQDRGIPRFKTELGQRVNNAVMRSYLRRAALAVPDVREVTSVTTGAVDPASREIPGNVEVKTYSGD